MLLTSTSSLLFFLQVLLHSVGVMSSNRAIRQILPRPRAHWVGDGFNVYPVFAEKAFTGELSPFLMFDYAAPKQFPARNPRKLGVGQHPHRGFETVTIAWQGEVEHADSTGNRGVIGAGDVQWMTAGRGIVHEEFHSKRFAREGGLLEMCQLWVNLPAKHKMTAPRYQPITRAEIPVAPLIEQRGDGGGKRDCVEADAAEGSVRVIAGNYRGVKGAALTFTQVDMWDIRFDGAAGRNYEFDTVEGNNVVVFVRKGRVQVQGAAIGPQDVAVMERDGSRIVIETVEPGSQVLLLAGAPIDEPVAARGPFVMNTDQELRKAMADYSSGNFGT